MVKEILTDLVPNGNGAGKMDLVGSSAFLFGEGVTEAAWFFLFELF